MAKQNMTKTYKIVAEGQLVLQHNDIAPLLTYARLSGSLLDWCSVAYPILKYKNSVDIRNWIIFDLPKRHGQECSGLRLTSPEDSSSIEIQFDNEV
jgi:hypothetical protein